MLNNLKWEHFIHTADIGIRGFGKTREEAFENAAIALTAVITRPESLKCSETVEIASYLTATSDDILLFDWLNAVIFSTKTKHMLFKKYHIERDKNGLCGIGFGEPIDENRHSLATEIKGATMTELAVYQQENGTFVAQCVVDV